MQYQTFRGADVEEALGHVRQALGNDALIESTRRVKSGESGGLGPSFVEIVAAPSLSPPDSKANVRAGAARERRVLAASRAVAREIGAAEQSSSTADSALARELAHLRLLLDELSQSRPTKDRARALLAAAGFEGALARTLGTGASGAVRGKNVELVRWLRQRVAEKVTCRTGLIEAPGRQLIACVGPTGVGKTTTLAKLAARAVLSLKRSVRVISLDTFRVGAVEQWRRYAELIGFPFDLANDAGAFHRIAHHATEEILLVDTAGRSVGQQRSALSGSVRGLRGIHAEVLLVLPAWLRARDASRVGAAYGVPAVTGIVITKLDETDQVGGVMHAPLESGLPITYLCNGARVPEDIHEAAVDKVLDAIFPEQA